MNNLIKIFLNKSQLTICFGIVFSVSLICIPILINQSSNEAFTICYEYESENEVIDNEIEELDALTLTFDFVEPSHNYIDLRFSKHFFIEKPQYLEIESPPPELV